MTKWDEWCLMWRCIGWHRLAAHSNFNTSEVLEICAGLLYRVSRLEMRDVSWFGVL